MISSYGLHRGLRLYVMRTRRKGESVFFCDCPAEPTKNKYIRIYAPIWWNLIEGVNKILGAY